MLNKISFRDIKVTYIGQGPASNYPSAFPANPDQPNAGEPRRFEGIDHDNDEPRCPSCKVRLFMDEEKNLATCPNCNSRFSKKEYDSAYSKRATSPGLFNLDGSNTNNPGDSGTGPNYHVSDSVYGGGSVWSNPSANNMMSQNYH